MPWNVNVNLKVLQYVALQAIHTDLGAVRTALHTSMGKHQPRAWFPIAVYCFYTSTQALCSSVDG